MSIDKQSKTADASIASPGFPALPGTSDVNAFDPVLCTKQLLRGARFGSMATLCADGAPFASLVNVATAIDGTPIILISRLAVHTQNITGNSRSSLLLAQASASAPSYDPAAQPRVSMSGHATISVDSNDRRRFLARHPGAASYADFADFAFYRIVPTHCHLIAGFGRIHTLSPDVILSERHIASDIAQIEEEAIAHLNEEHQDALLLYATVLAGAESGNWQAVGIDPEGIDLIDGYASTRVWFDRPLEDKSQLRPTLAALAARARER